MDVKRRRLFFIMFIAELAVLMFLAAGLLRDGSNTVVSELVFESGEDCVISSPISLRGGDYYIAIVYSCDREQFGSLKSSMGQVLADEVRLIPSENIFGFRVGIKGEVPDLRLVFDYDGTSSFEIDSATVMRGSYGVRRNIFICCILFLLLNLACIYSEWIKKHKNEALAVVLMLFLTSLPLMSGWVTYGDDLRFHLMRIEGIAGELKKGEFPVKIASAWLDGYGYPVSVYYGDILLYIPAILRITGFSVVGAYKLYVLLINAGTIIISYICFKKIIKDEKIALLMCLAYCTATYRVVNIYVRAAVGEYSAMMFLPVAALALYRIYAENNDSVREGLKTALILTIGMTGLIETHLLSTEMTVLLMAVLCIVLYKKTFRRNTLFMYLAAIVGTLLINLFFLVPFVDYYTKVPVNINNHAVPGVHKIQSAGVYPYEYFAFFRDAYSEVRSVFTPGIMLMAVLIAALFFIVNNKSNKKIRILTGFSLLTLFMATNIFPWDFIESHVPFGELFAQVQFPWRYMGIAILLLTILFGEMLLYEFSKRSYDGIFIFVKCLCVAACIFMMCLFVGNFMDCEYKEYYHDTMGKYVYNIGGGEYLRFGSDVDNLSGAVSGEGFDEAYIVSRDKKGLEVYCRMGENGGFLEFPVFNYKGYRVVDEFGKIYDIADGANNKVSVLVPAGFEGKLLLSFVRPHSWRLAEIISLVSVFGVALYMVFDKSSALLFKKRV